MAVRDGIECATPSGVGELAGSLSRGGYPGLLGVERLRRSDAFVRLSGRVPKSVALAVLGLGAGTRAYAVRKLGSVP